MIIYIDITPMPPINTNLIALKSFTRNEIDPNGGQLVISKTIRRKNVYNLVISYHYYDFS